MMKKTMSVREMGALLGLKKVDSYWLVHKNYFKTVLVMLVGGCISRTGHYTAIRPM